jgi:hypothetical protein
LGFALTEIPTLDTLNSTFLVNFDGLIILDPEEEFTLEEQAALSEYIEEGNPVLFFPNDESESTTDGLNNVLLDHGIEVFGSVSGNQTSSFNTSEWPELFEGLSDITFYKATSVLSSSPGLISKDSHTILFANRSTVNIIVYTSAETFSDLHIQEADNHLFLHNLLKETFDNILLVEAFLPPNTPIDYPQGSRVYIDLMVFNTSGHEVENLEVFAAFYLPNGNTSFIFASHVTGGQYVTFFLPLFYNGTGDVYTIFLIQKNDQYIGTYASTKFTITEYTAPPPPDVQQSLFEMFYNLITTVIVIGSLVVVVGGYLISKRKPAQRMRVPELREEFMTEVDNVLNLLNITFKGILGDLENPETDNLYKVVQAFTELDDLKPTLPKLRRMAREIGGK